VDAVVPVKNSFFLVPDRLIKTEERDFSITLLDDHQGVLLEARSVRLPA